MRVTSSHPPGKYYIGDICYALDYTVYQEQWGGNFEYGAGTHAFKYNGFRGLISVNRTQDGDGTFYDGELEFSVDSGTIGLVPLKLCCQKNIKDDKIHGGHFIESDSPVEFESSNGIFHIRYIGRHMVIKTSSARR